MLSSNLISAKDGSVRRGLDPWPSKGNRVPSKECARKLVGHLKLCGWEIHRPLPKSMHQT